MSITSEWTKGKIGDICIVGDGAHAKVERQISGVMYLTSKNLKDGRLDISQVTYISETDFNKHFRDESKALTKIKPNDVIFGIIGTIGEPYIVNSRDRFGISSSVAILRPNKSVIFPKYLFYWIENRIFQDALYAIKGGVAQGYVSLEMIRSLPLYYPLLSIQKKIASILSSYDNLIENNTRRIEILEQMAKLIYEEWFVKFRFPGHEYEKIIDGVPEGWKKTNALEIMDVLSGGTPKTSVPDFWDGGIPFFTPKDSTDTPYVLETEKNISEQGLSKCSSKLYPKDTIFITARGTVGKLNLAQVPMAMNQSCYALVGKEPLTQYFLYCALHATIDQFKSRAVGAVFDAIIRDTFKAIPFVIPSKNLINDFTETVASSFKQIDNLIMQNRNLKETRDLLLPKLISGEIDVSDLDIHIRNEFQES
jgi:type I restriction enzyme, S subunit